MNVNRLIDFLKMLPSDTEVHLQTVPDDFTSPLESWKMKVVRMHQGGLVVILTAHIPSEAA